MNLLQTGSESLGLFPDENGNTIYLAGTIYELIEKKYDQFKHYDQSEYQRDTQYAAVKMHEYYTKLVEEYQNKAKEYKNTFSNKIERIMQQDYLSRLDSDDFDEIVTELDKHLSVFIEKRAAMLIQWLERSNYLQVINDLSFINNIDLSTLNDQLWIDKYKIKLRDELYDALDNDEIDQKEFSEFNYFNINGYYFSSVFARTVQGLELAESSKEFFKKLSDLGQLTQINLNSRIEIKTHFWVLALRAWIHDHSKVFNVFLNIFNLVMDNADKPYIRSELDKIKIKGIGAFAFYTRQTTLMLEYFKEIQTIKNSALMRHGVTINTTFGPNRWFIRLFTNLDSLGFIPACKLFCYDQLVKLCNLVSDQTFRLGVVLADACITTLSGAVWASAKVYVNLKYQLLEAWILAKKHSAGIDIGGGLRLVSNAYNAQIKRLISELKESLNIAIAKLDSRFTVKLIEIDQSFKRILNRTFYIIPDTTAKFVNLRKIHLRSVGLAYIVGAFEVYSWNYVMEKEPNLFKDDDDILLEKLTATAALGAAVADIVATTVKVIKGENAIFAYAKVTFSLFGALTSVTSAIRMFRGMAYHWQSGNLLAAFLGFLSGSLYLMAGGTITMLGLSYRYAWVHTFYRKRLARQLVNVIGRKALMRLSAMAMRMLLYRFFGALGFIAMVIELLYDYFSDNEIQVFLSYSALGKYKGKYKYRYAFDQRQAFKSIELLSALVNQKEPELVEEKVNQQNNDDKPMLQHAEIILQAENYVTEWLKHETITK